MGPEDYDRGQEYVMVAESLPDPSTQEKNQASLMLKAVEGKGLKWANPMSTPNTISTASRFERVQRQAHFRAEFQSLLSRMIRPEHVEGLSSWDCLVQMWCSHQAPQKKSLRQACDCLWFPARALEVSRMAAWAHQGVHTHIPPA